MAVKDRMSGNEAVSYAIRQINPDVMPAFPITPSTEIPQLVSSYIAVALPWLSCSFSKRLLS